ncbi:MAG TPA: SirB2 family protein, partial [Bacteroidia bacterium]|nr:SirB2 family protein [Bacteroidia bacterium]
MSSALLAKIHFISALLFLILYLVKLILLFTNKKALQSMTAVTKVPEMIISTLFLVTGVWLLVILGGIKLFHIIKLVFVFLAIPLGVIGFKKQRYAAAILSVLFIVLAYGMAEMSKNKPFL